MVPESNSRIHMLQTQSGIYLPTNFIRSKFAISIATQLHHEWTVNVGSTITFFSLFDNSIATDWIAYM